MRCHFCQVGTFFGGLRASAARIGHSNPGRERIDSPRKGEKSFLREVTAPVREGAGLLLLLLLLLRRLQMRSDGRHTSEMHGFPCCRGESFFEFCAVSAEPQSWQHESWGLGESPIRVFAEPHLQSCAKLSEVLPILRTQGLRLSIPWNPRLRNPLPESREGHCVRCC